MCRKIWIICFCLTAMAVLENCSEDSGTNSNETVMMTPSPAKAVKRQLKTLRLSEDIISATWTSSNPDIARYVSNTSFSGDFRCNAEGTVTIKAEGNGKSAQTQLQVVPNGTWEAVPLSFPHALHSISDAQFLDENTGWICGGSAGFAYITEDGGQTWQNRFPSSFNISWISQLFFLNKSIGWVVAQSGEIFKTTDSGLSWTLLVDIGVGPINDLTFTDTNTGFVASSNGLYQTSDGGNTWTKSQEGGFSKVFFVDADYGWAIESRENYRTTNGGVSWIQGPRIHPSPGSASQLYFEDRNTGWFIKGGKIYRTADGGVTYEEYLTDGFSPPVTAVSWILKANENVGWALSGGKYYQTADGFETAEFQLQINNITTKGIGYAGSRIYVFTTQQVLFNEQY